MSDKEILILEILLDHGGEMYTEDIFEQLSGRGVMDADLTNLEWRCFIASRPEKQDEPRKLYRIVEQGRRVLIDRALKD